MCILFLYFCDKPSPDGYRFIMASNRDEFYFRPTANAKFWEKNPNLIAGKTFFMHCMHGFIIHNLMLGENVMIPTNSHALCMSLAPADRKHQSHAISHIQANLSCLTHNSKLLQHV